MSGISDILSSLKNSAKGRIKYDQTWFEDGRLQEVLNDCTTPPPLSPIKSPPGLKTDSNPKVCQNDMFSGADAVAEINSPETISQLVKDEKKSTSRKNDSCDGRDQSENELDVVITAQNLKVEKMLKDADFDLQTQWRLNMEKRRELYDTHSRVLLRNSQNKMLQLYELKQREADRLLSEARQQEQTKTEEVKRKHIRLREHHKEHAKLLDEKMQEAHKTQMEEEEKEAKRKQQSIERRNRVIQIYADLQQVQKSLAASVASCQYPDHLPESHKKWPDGLGQLIRKTEEFSTLAKKSDVPERDLHVLNEYLTKASGFLEYVKGHVDAVNKKGKDEADKKQKDLEQQRQLQQQQLQQQQQASANTRDETVLGGSTSREAFTVYTKLQEQQKELAHSYETITKDPNVFLTGNTFWRWFSFEELAMGECKKFKFDVQKAVNTPLNSISPVSGSHLCDKLDKLRTLLTGGAVEVGTKRVSAASHPAGLAFCKDLFARQVVKQGEDLVSAKHESAFAIAAVVAGVLSQVPGVKDLVLAHFHRRCPYIVPYYMRKEENQTPEQYYTSLGYLYEDNQCEKQDKFLSRMSGMMRLYAAILVTSPPRGAAASRSPMTSQQAMTSSGLTLEDGWTWLTRIMNLDPRPDITATLLYDFLQVTGHGFLKSYKKQFVKLVEVLKVDFLPRVLAVTPQGAGGPVHRLESFFQAILNTRQIPEPKGTLSPNFWFT